MPAYREILAKLPFHIVEVDGAKVRWARPTTSEAILDLIDYLLDSPSGEREVPQELETFHVRCYIGIRDALYR